MRISLLESILRSGNMINANKDTYLERYRSGHNEAVLKTVCPKGRVGSNPTLSVKRYLKKPKKCDKVS